MTTNPKNFPVSTFLANVVISVVDEYQVAQLRRCELDVSAESCFKSKGKKVSEKLKIDENI